MAEEKKINDPTKPSTDLKVTLESIKQRSIDRQKAVNESRAKLNAARIERSKNRKANSGGGSGLAGLASFSSTTGK